MADKTYNVLFICTATRRARCSPRALPLESLDRMAIQKEIKQIGTAEA
jgi:hypothetical protein